MNFDAAAPTAERILVLFGSANQKGYTQTLLKLFLENYLPQLHNTYAIETVYITEQKYLPCSGCGACQQTGICPWNHKDHYDRLLQKIDAADTIILASPLYFMNFPAPVKAMIDRTQQIFAQKFFTKTRSMEQTKKGILIASCGSADKEGFIPMKSTAKLFFQCIGAGFAQHLFACNTDHPQEIQIFD